MTPSDSFFRVELEQVMMFFLILFSFVGGKGKVWSDWSKVEKLP